MGNDLVLYRAAIGLFNTRKRGRIENHSYCNGPTTYQEILLTNFRCSFHTVALTVLHSINPNINVVFLLFVLHFILLVGNVEQNPGPDNLSIDDNSISICNINIRSIRNKLEFLHNFVEEFDLIAITETHLDPTVTTTELELDSFASRNILRKDRNNFGGGLLIYAKDDISLSRKAILENDIDETIWVEVKARGQSFLLCNTYRPEWTDQGYWGRLNHAIELACQINENIVITGDLNSDLFNTYNNKLVDTMNLFNLVNVIDKPTRVTERTSTLLDPILLSDNLIVEYSDVLNIPNNISDHDAAVVFLQSPKSASRSFQRNIWLYDRADVNLFSDRIRETDWNEMFENRDIDEMCNLFTNKVIGIAKDCIPSKMVTIRSNDKPWFNNQLRKEIRLRDKLRKKVIKYKRVSDIHSYKNNAIKLII